MNGKDWKNDKDAQDLIILGKAFRENRISQDTLFAGFFNLEDRKNILSMLRGNHD
jgi:hypothetical protein